MRPSFCTSPRCGSTLPSPPAPDSTPAGGRESPRHSGRRPAVGGEHSRIKGLVRCIQPGGALVVQVGQGALLEFLLAQTGRVQPAVTLFDQFTGGGGDGFDAGSSWGSLPGGRGRGRSRKLWWGCSGAGLREMCPCAATISHVVEIAGPPKRNHLHGQQRLSDSQEEHRQESNRKSGVLTPLKFRYIA